MLTIYKNSSYADSPSNEVRSNAASKQATNVHECPHDLRSSCVIDAYTAPPRLSPTRCFLSSHANRDNPRSIHSSPRISIHPQRHRPTLLILLLLPTNAHLPRSLSPYSPRNGHHGRYRLTGPVHGTSCTMASRHHSGAATGLHRATFPPLHCTA